ncbi:MAG TPA: glycosyltransferase [Thermoplasmata archaeon]|nr:glycosyltransferase [Thermoplasmata archaeon]
MRVLLLSPFWRPVVGGISRYVEGLRQALIDKGHDVLVCSLSGAEARGVTILTGSRVAGWRQVKKLAIAFRPDALHVHGHWALLIPALLARRVLPGARVVFTFHTAVRPRGIRGRLFRALLNRCDFVTAVSADLLARVTRQFRIHTPVSVTFPGATLAEAGAAKDGERLRHGFGIDASALLLVSVSPLQYPHKVAGLMDLLRAFAEVRAVRSDVFLLLVGDGPYRRELEQLANVLGLDSAVRFLGATDTATPAFMAADVVCHLSYQDELPLVILEAMASGKPILCSPIGGIPEVLPDDAAVYVEGGVREIAEGLNRILGDSELRRVLGEEGRARIRRSLTWGHAAARLLPLYGASMPKRIHFSVDLEEDYLLAGPTYRGIQEGLPRLLELFRKHDIPASFFLTADVVQRFPELPQRLQLLGHHVGSHGVSHAAPPFAGRPLPDQKRDLVSASQWLHEIRENPRSFRGPNFQVDPATLRALPGAGFQVDSSVVPGRLVRMTRKAPRIDFRGAPIQSYHVSPTHCTRIGNSSLVEVPVAPNPAALGSPLGLGYLNLAGPQKAMEALVRSGATDIVFLIHPWEAIDYPSDVRTPAWMVRGCQSDLSSLDGFLDIVRDGHSIVPFVGLLETALRSNSRWWSPGPWGDLVPRPVVLLVTNVFRPVTGGISTYVSNLASSLKAFGYPVRVLTYPAALVMREAQKGRSPLRKLFHAAFVGSVLLRVAVMRLSRTSVLVHSHGSSFCLIAAALARAMGAVTLHTFHSPLHHRSRILEWFGPRVDALLFVSDATRRLYEESVNIPHDRLAIATGGVQPVPRATQAERNEARSRFRVPDNAFVVLFVGRVVPEKGVDVAIEALAHMQGRDSRIHLFVAGPRQPGPRGDAYVARLQALGRERGVADRVRFLGLLPSSRLEELFRAADALVIPSRWEEPAPIVALEGMIRGLPVIATRVGGLGAIIEDGGTGLLIPSEDPRALAEATRRLADDPTLVSRLGSSAQHWTSRHASAEAVGAFHSRIYRALWRDAFGR